MNLADIKAFVALAEAGSINRAAFRLNLTQPAMSRRIQNFEAAMGDAPLLDRSAKPPVLTPIGRHVLEHCRTVLRAVAELQASTAGTDEPSGELALGLAHGLADIVLTSPLDELRRRFAKLRLNATSDWTAQLIERVRDGKLDAAIGLLTAEHVVPHGVNVTTLGAERVVIVAGDRSLGGNFGPLSLSDLAGEGWILNPTGCGCRAFLHNAFDRARLEMRVAAEVFGEDLQLSLIARSGGLGLVPERQLRQSEVRRQLRVLDVTDFELNVRIVMLHRPALGALGHAVALLSTQIGGLLASH